MMKAVNFGIDAGLQQADRRWARLIVAWGYPFDWCDRATFPSEDQLNALAEAWYRREPSCPVEEWRELIDNEIRP